MKRILYRRQLAIVTFLFSLTGGGGGGALILTSCSQKEVPTYDPAETQLNIWVGTAAGVVYESATYNYSYAYEEGSVPFYAQITGMPVDYDRSFRLEVTGDDADAVAPTLRTEDYVIPAGAIGGTYALHLGTQQLTDASLFTDRDGTVQLRVVPSETFSIGTEGYQFFTLIVKNYLAKPDNWDAVPTRNDMLIFYPIARYFGSYSRVKYQFMIEHLGLVDFQIQASMGSLPNYVEETNTISASYAVQLQQQMQQALSEYNATHDTPLTDEYGYEVTF
ncbi:MAG: DUF4843 domain-containing protein [Bacteroidaceae bacterium]|nr:DUF4843 domain-containing protein [Bacteroidaceae bacterium]MBR1800870.1 DUF4843 domain-containing protein [Bacteroidaceae bacterium]